MNEKPSRIKRLKNFVIGDAHSPEDRSVFHKLPLIAFFAWVGLGADGLSSSCYGPQEAFLALRGHEYLAIFVALGTALTIFVICASYNPVATILAALLNGIPCRDERTGSAAAEIPAPAGTEVDHP